MFYTAVLSSLPSHLYNKQIDPHGPSRPAGKTPGMRISRGRPLGPPRRLAGGDGRPDFQPAGDNDRCPVHRIMVVGTGAADVRPSWRQLRCAKCRRPPATFPICESRWPRRNGRLREVAGFGAVVGSFVGGARSGEVTETRIVASV